MAKTCLPWCKPCGVIQGSRLHEIVMGIFHVGPQCNNKKKKIIYLTLMQSSPSSKVLCSSPSSASISKFEKKYFTDVLFKKFGRIKGRITLLAVKKSVIIMPKLDMSLQITGL